MNRPAPAPSFNFCIMDVPALSKTESILGRESGGFDFTYQMRNARLVESLGAGSSGPRFHKTGTTICGVVFAGG